MTKQTGLPAFSSEFLREFADMDHPAPERNTHPSRGRPPLLPVSDIVAALAWHVMQPAATFAQNLSAFIGQQMSDSALSERRQALGMQPWEDALVSLLRPVANPRLHPHAFYRGLCLKGTDGTTFSVANTPPMKRCALKTKARRGCAAFHRLACVALVELGTHNPVSVRIGRDNESEGVLAGRIIEDLRTNDLLIADRYYGSGKWVARLMALPQKPAFLLRVQERFSAQRVRRLPDGSSIVTVKDPDSGQPMTLREIKGCVRRSGHRWVRVRFWTNLLDHRRYPAAELLQLYAMRWEQEIAFRELKHYLHDEHLLLSHTTVTAGQEICALFMAQAVVARVRSMTAANHNVPLLQVSFTRALNACRNFGWLIAIAGTILSPEQLQQIACRIEDAIAAQLTKKRRRRSCPRMVRQPVNKWPRLMQNSYQEGTFTYKLRKS